MNKAILFSTLCLLLSLVSCGGDSEPNPLPDEPPIAAGDLARRSCLVYAVADNNLKNYLQTDLNEMLAGAKGVPSDCYMLAYVDDDRSPRILRFFNNAGVGDYETVHIFDREMASCDIEDMREVLEWVQLNYPSSAMDLVLWSHASGWLYDDGRLPQTRSFGDDGSRGEGSCRRMNVEELAALLKDVSPKPERLFFDACFMQCVESAYALRESVDWVVASPAEIPAEGAPYDIILPLFFDPAAGIQDILDAYKASYEGTETGVVLSAVRSSMMQQLATATADVVKRFFSSVLRDACDGVFAYLPGAYFGTSNSYPDFYDINSMMCEQLPYAEYMQWKSVFDAAVPYRSASKSWYSAILDRNYSATEEDYVMVDESWGGVSMYLPDEDSRFEDFNYSFRFCEWYKAAGWEEAGR